MEGIRMKANDLYNQLEKDFVVPGITEDWYEDKSKYDASFDEFICDNFKHRSMGLLCDFAKEINKVYTAVFPSDKVMMKILNDKTTDAMLFLHHPLDWDLSKDPNTAFYQINTEFLNKLRENRVSLFNYHLTLDNYGQYSTGTALANALDITIERPFDLYNGAMCGVIGTTKNNNVHELNDKYSQVVGHKTKLYQYGDKEIINNRVGICAGGGNDVGVVNELIKSGINVLISGLTVNNTYSAAAHKLEEEHRINLIGGTHYSSEKFACMAVCEYFKQLGLQAEFIEDIPCFEDL
jgi:putative NIF3 family GTP cyclohydrolase 1 type 2